MDLNTIERPSVDADVCGIVRSVHVDFIRVPMTQKYSMAGFDYSNADYKGMVVRVRTEGGIEGIGEVFMSAGWYSVDTPASCLFLVEQIFAPKIVGQSVFEVARLFDGMERLWKGNYWPKTAVELALHDAAAKSLNRSLIDLIGGKVRDKFPVIGGVGTDTPEEMARIARGYVARGFKTIKVKIGERAAPDLDVARIRVVREEIGPDIALRADANGVFDVPTSIRLIGRLERFDLEHIEQPVPDWDLEGMATIRNSIGVPLMADECVHTPRDALRVIAAKAADVVKIKIAKCGGYRKAQEVAAICTAAGVDVVVGNGKGTSAASLHELFFVCSSPAIHAAGEFPGPEKLATDILLEPMKVVDGEAILPAGPGIGSELDYGTFEACRVGPGEIAS